MGIKQKIEKKNVTQVEQSLLEIFRATSFNVNFDDYQFESNFRQSSVRYCESVRQCSSFENLPFIAYILISLIEIA